MKEYVSTFILLTSLRIFRSSVMVQRHLLVYLHDNTEHVHIVKSYV
jgi:hypothetical protein